MCVFISLSAGDQRGQEYWIPWSWSFKELCEPPGQSARNQIKILYSKRYQLLSMKPSFKPSLPALESKVLVTWL